MMAVCISLPTLAVWPRQILVLDSNPFCFFLFIYFETESLYAALAIVELAMWTRLDSTHRVLPATGTQVLGLKVSTPLPDFISI